MTLQVLIGGNPVTIREATLKITSRVDDKDKATFTLKDDTGTLTFQKGQTVKITDSSLGTLFSGYVNKPTCTNLFPNATNEWAVDCVNHFYVPAKRVTSTGTNSRRGGRRHRGGKHVKQHSGAIAALQIQEYLEPSGVTGNFGLDWTELQADWQSGTLSGTAGTTNASTGNVGAGDLELAPSGPAMTHLEQATADFSTGTLGSVVASNNSLILNSRQGIAVSAQCTAQNSNNNYLYYKIWGGSYSIVSGDALQYSMWINAASPEIKIAIDGVCSDGTTIKNYNSSGLVDQNGFQATPKTNLKGWADNQWYTRTISISGLAGKTLNSIQIGFEGDSQGTYTAYFYNVQIINGANTKVVAYNGGALNTSSQASNAGYGPITISTPTVYDQVGYRNSANVSIASVGAISTTNVLYTVSTPTGTSAILNTSFDGGATWQLATNSAAIPGLFVGMNTSGMNMATQEILSITGNDPIVTPAFTSISWTITPALSATKTDVLSTYNSSANFNAGTYTSTQLITSQATNTPTFLQYGASQAVTLNGAWRNWNDSSLANQSVFGSASPSQNANQGQLNLKSGNGADVKSQFVFAGQWQNFIASMDVLIPATTGEEVGFVYRTTFWGNGNYTYGYSAHVYQNSINLNYGTNNSSGGATTITVATNVDLPANTWHRLTIIVNGTNHQVFVDGVQYINATDATYNFAGYIGARARNGSGGTVTYSFDNFGVVPALSGTWLSPIIPLNSVGSVGSSLVQWNQATLPAGTGITAQASVDGGATYQPVSNGGAIPQLPDDTNVSGVNLLLLFTLTSGSASTSPALNSISVSVSAAYGASGSRTNAPLGSDTMNRLDVSNSFGISSDGQFYAQNGTATTSLTTREAQITNTTGDLHMQLGMSTGTDEDGTVHFQITAATISAGIELRYIDVNNCYRLAATQNSLSIIFRNRGVSTTLATATPTLALNTYYHMRFRVVGSLVGSIVSYGRVWSDGMIEPSTWTITAMN